VGYYAIVTPAFVGHVNPMTVLARAIQKRGHRVAFIAPLDVKAKAERAGVEYIEMAAREFPLGEWDVWTAKLGELASVKANRFAGHWIGAMSRAIIRDLPEIIAREKFDGIVMDQISLGTEAVCEVTNTPLAVACCALAANPEWGIPPGLFPWNYNPSIFGRLRNCLGYAIGNLSGLTVWRAVSPYRRKNRLAMMRSSHMSQLRPSLVQVTQQPRFFDFPREYLPTHFHYTGPWRESVSQSSGDFPWDRIDGRPLIYASLGTLQNRLQHVFRIIAEACSTLDVQLVIALGNKNATPPPNLAGNPIVIGYAPQTALLRRANMVISHCGLNTTLETLSEGLPLVGIPITNDQPGVATRVEHLGVGLKIPIKRLTTERLRNAVQQIQSDGRYRVRARELASEIAQVDAPALAAELIETAFTTRRPVTAATLRRASSAKQL
jgi:zeaxanthin glucosyltransferase